MKTYSDTLQQLLNFGLDISQIKDIDVLLEKILTEARRFTNCDAGTIYIKDGTVLSNPFLSDKRVDVRL